MAELERTAELISKGILCPVCFTDTRRRGCKCSRERAYNRDAVEVLAWFESLPEEVKFPRKKGLRLQGSMNYALQRLQARAADGVSEDRAEVDRVLYAHATHPNPKWHPPQSVRTKRADHEPL